MTDLEQAQNPQTSQKILEQLALARALVVRLAVAKNPNTPEAVLSRLAALYPEAVLENPVLDWLRFENPAWFEQLPTYASFALLGAKSCPSGWLEAAERLGIEAQLAALRNPNLPASLLKNWLGNAEARVADAILGHVANSHQAKPMSLHELERNSELFKDVLAAGLALEPEVLAVLAADYDTELRTFVAMRPDLSDTVLEMLAFDEDETVAKMAQANQVSDFVIRAEQLRLKSARDFNRLASGSVRARRLAVQHSNITKKVLTQLAQDDDWRVRQDVAKNPKTPSLVLVRLAADHDRDVRQAIAANPSSSSTILENLLADSHEAVRLAARSNKNAPPKTVRLLEQLENKDPHLTDLEQLPRWMAALVAAHPNISPKLLETFAKNEESEVRIAVARNPKTPQRMLEDLLDDPDVEVLLSLLERPHLPDFILSQLATHIDTRVTESLSAHLGLSKRLLEDLAKNSNWQVRRNIAAHPRCPTITLEQLSQDPDADVRESAVGNVNANPLVALYALGVELRLPQVLHQLQTHDPNLSVSWLEFVARRGNDLAKRLVASHGNLSHEIMTWFLTHDDFKIRLALVLNPSLPPALLEQLAEDADRDVRVAVATRANTATLKRLATDADALVRCAVAQRGVAFEILCWDEDDSVLECIPQEYLALRQKLEAGLPFTPQELEPLLEIPLVLQHLPPTALLPNLELCLRHEMWQVRLAAAGNQHCTPAQLETLLTDPDRDVRAQIAKHPNTTPKLLSHLMRDDDILVRRAALSSPALEPNLRATAQRYILDESLRSSSLNRLVALGLTTRVSEICKRRNAQSPEWRERLAVANNPNTPVAILEQLATDANRLVRAAAQQRLEVQS